MTGRRENDLLLRLQTVTGSESGRLGERVQSLWSGYGAIYRYHPGGGRPPLIVKSVTPPTERRHPRGWVGDKGHERKLRSYDVELHWYESASRHCDEHIRIADACHLERNDEGWLFVLEDLDHAGFSGRRATLSQDEARGCLKWLASFHVQHLGLSPRGLWEQGTYWHLATRPDELESMEEPRLRRAAGAIDEELEKSPFRTWVHGDAKVANFCFSKSGEVAVVDFQYVGGGVGVKDVAYFLSSCLDEWECLRDADRWVEEYFSFLSDALGEMRPELPALEIVADWRRLYRYAWADFVRFLVGWAPEHYKIHGYSRKMTDWVLQELGY